MDKELKREIILDNYQNPVNHGLIDDPSYIKVNTSSESCIDNLDVMMKIDNNKIIDIRFDGEACAISTSATSIMINMLIGKEKMLNEIPKYYSLNSKEEAFFIIGDAEYLLEQNPDFIKYLKENY